MGAAMATATAIAMATAMGTVVTAAVVGAVVDTIITGLTGCFLEDTVTTEEANLTRSFRELVAR